MPNALSREKSPYLLQHADNPVDWLPWGEASFARARDEQKPIFLSIGYSTCHWCHVMAHESFESETVAKILNEHFVSIKVDREERPDVDKVYMAYVQAMTGHGGWPLSVWLSPDLKPFYGGTYFPPDDRHGRPGFPALLHAIARGWREQRDQLVAEGDRAVTALQEHFNAARGSPDGVPLADAAAKALAQGFAHFRETFDRVHGGFGGAPKFPRASSLTFLLRVAAMQGPGSEMGSGAITMAAATLRSMAGGGIHDHVGGGFHRYSVDEAWAVPHFEKMLTDQAQIALNCLEAKQATGDERFGWLVRDILDYVRRDLTSPEGGFYTAEDADSVPQGDSAASDAAESAGAQGKRKTEGAFYQWSAAGLRELLGGDYALFAAHFGIDEAGNVPARLDPHGEFSGRNILAQQRSLIETAREGQLTPDHANERLIDALTRLRAVRERRPRPERDDKVVTAGNGLMISALARAHQVLDPALSGGNDADDHLARAIRGAEFIQRELHDPARGVLYRTWRNGRGSTEAFAEDYAFLIQGLLDLYEACFDIRWLQWAERLQARMDERFRDHARGGYFNSAAGDPGIVLRLQEAYDGSEPAPSSVAAMNLLRLAAMLGEPSAHERGHRTIDAFREHWSKIPQATPQMLCALELALVPPRHVVIAGDPGSPDFRSLTAVLHERLGPRRALLAADGGEAQAWLALRSPWIEKMRPIGGRATAYVCEDCACQAPVSDAGELRRILGESRPDRFI